MSTPTFVILDETTLSRSGDDDDIDHIWCVCTGVGLALCGARLNPEDALWGEDWEADEDTCVVCLDLESQPCGCDA